MSVILSDTGTASPTGKVDPAFAQVAKQFRSTVADGDERGALHIRLEGRPVIDIRGGSADPASGTPWQSDTLACCFSVTKGVFALLAHRLAEQGDLDLDAPVAVYWPEFGAAGKGAITVLDVLTHRAGLPTTDTPAKPGSLYDPAAMAASLAASPSVVPTMAAPAYHNMTFGTLMAEVMQRATGVGVQTLIKEELTTPLGADFAIGLTPSERARTAVLTQDDPTSLFRALTEAPDTLFARSMAFFEPDETFMTGRWQTTVIGSGSGHATAEGIARLYEALIGGSLLSPERRASLATVLAETEEDPVLGLPLRLSAGFELSNPPLLDFGPSPGAMGYWGAGGAQGFADPDADLAFGYVTGRMDPTLGSSPRCRALIKELYACL